MAKLIKTTLPQTTETNIQTKECEGFDIHFAYSRKNERISDNSIGEDFLVFQQNGEKLCVALCDGVGSSFMPHLVSELLGQNINNWLWGFQDYSIPIDNLKVSFRSFLEELSGEPSDKINHHAISEKYGRRSVIAQEMKREKGGESVFISSLIDKAKDYALFVWMGDSRIHLWDRNGEIGKPFEEIIEKVLSRNNDQVIDYWSTQKGAVGELNIFKTKLSELSLISIYSDGLKKLDAYINSYPDHESIQNLIENQFYAPDSDDISFIEIINKPTIKQLSERPKLNLPAKTTISTPATTDKQQEESNQLKTSTVPFIPIILPKDEENRLRKENEMLVNELQKIRDENHHYGLLASKSPEIIKENEDRNIFHYSSGSKSIDILIEKKVNLNSIGEISFKTTDSGNKSEWSKPRKIPMPKKVKRSRIGIFVTLLLSLLLNFWFFGIFLYNLIKPSEPIPTETPTVTPTNYVTDTPRPTKIIMPTEELFVPFITEIPDTITETQEVPQTEYTIDPNPVFPEETDSYPEPTNTLDNTL